MDRRAGGLIALMVLALALALAPTLGRAQAPPVNPPAPPGFVPPYEVMRTVRAAGFDPLALPLREGTTYVVRATDFRGILMRVVVDARTGAIRDANRILPGPGSGPYGPYGRVGMVPQPYDSPDDMPSLYDRPPHPDVPAPPLAAVPAASAPHAATALPLPRPRPLFAGNAGEATKPAVAPMPAAPPAPPASAAAAAPAKPKPPSTLMINN